MNSASLTETLAWLVDIPSETGSETAICEAIAGRLSSFLQIRIKDSLVVGEPSPGGVLMVGHTDTVPNQGQGLAFLEGDRLHGLGSTDMKAGLAVMIHLLEERGGDGLAAVFYAGEEGPYADNELEDVLDQVPALTEVGVAVVLEPTDRKVEAGCNGVINATVSFDGVAAHSARPWRGENAVTKSAPFLVTIDGFEPEPHLVSGLEFVEVISVTRAQGGVANNIIPARFELNLNYRFAPDRSLAEAEARLAELCHGADGFEIADSAPAGAVDTDHPFLQTLAEVSGSDVVGKQGWTDVARLTSRGVPAVNFGPGETALAHTVEESVRLSDLVWAYQALSTALD